MMKNLLLTLALSALLFGGCASREIVPSEPPDLLYSKGVKALKAEEYDLAKKYGEAIRQEYPFSPLAVEAELLDADIYFAEESFEAAVQSYSSFVDLHPFHEKAPYALYRRGLSYFMLIDTPDRDVTHAIEAVKTLDRFLKAAPQSPFAAEAREKRKAATDILADHELCVAQFYVRSGKIDSALTRLKGLVRDYPGARVAPKAAQMMADLEAKAEAKPLDKVGAAGEKKGS